MNLKQQIEVFLFWSDNGLSIKDLSELTQVSQGEIKDSLSSLIRDYETRESALEITCQNGIYILEVGEKFSGLGEKILPADLKTSTARTLALIALKEPVKQSEIIETRGSSAYTHIKELAEKNWIKKEQDGLSYKLKTTSEFKKYFNLSSDGKKLKLELKKLESNIPETQENTENNIQENIFC